MTPITPSQVRKTQPEIPEVVFQVVNDMLTDEYQSSKSKTITLLQNDIVDKLVEKGLNRDTIFDKHYLDFEPFYRKAGWKIEFNKMPYYEMASNEFIFKMP